MNYFIILIFIILFLPKEILLIQQNRKERALLFPNAATIGFIAALAIPLNLPKKNVFLSYNFEANYISPSKASQFIPGPLKRFESSEQNNNVEETKTKRSSKNIKSKRQDLYSVFERKLKHFNFSGRSCLERLICEYNYYDIKYNNGVLGDILHILFSPSSTKNEHLSKNFYKAELQGLQNNCADYYKTCDKSLLNIISI